MDTSVHVQPVSPQQGSASPLPHQQQISEGDYIMDNKHITPAQTTGIIGAIIALLALILFVVARSRRES